MRPRPSSRGLSLLELLIAAGIFALIGMASLSMYSAVKKAERLVEARQGRRTAVRNTLALLRREIASLLTTQGLYDTGLIGSLREEDGETDGTINLVSRLQSPFRAGAGECDIVSIVYRLNRGVDSSAEGGLYRFVDTSPDRIEALDQAFPTEEGEASGWELILPGATAFQLEYYDGQDWLEVWDSLQSETLPLALRVSIELEPEDAADEEAQAKGERKPERWVTIIALRQATEVEDLATAPEKPEEEGQSGQSSQGAPPGGGQ